MNDIPAQSVFTHRLVRALEEDAKLTSSKFPREMQRETKAGRIAFNGTGKLKLDFLLSEHRIPHPTNNSRAAAHAGLQNERQARLSREWVRDWLDDRSTDYLTGAVSRQFREICPTCSGDRKEGCPDCHGQGEVKCSAWGCSHGQVSCTSCGGDGKKSCSYCYGAGSKSEQVRIVDTVIDGRENWHYETRSVSCSTCGGSGRHGRCYSCINGEVNCSICRGTSKVGCARCEGGGKITCHDCSGHGHVSLDMVMVPVVRVTISRAPDDQAQVFKFCSKHVPGYLDQKAAQEWANVSSRQEGTAGSFTFRSSANHASSSKPVAAGAAEVWIGHETLPPYRSQAFREELARPTLQHLEAASFDKMREYPLGSDVLRRLLTGEHTKQDSVEAYGLAPALSEAMSRAARSVERYIGKGQWAWLSPVLVVAAILALLQNSPVFLALAGERMSFSSAAPVLISLIYLPWGLLLIALALIAARRRRRATELLGDKVKPSGRTWLTAAASLLAVQLLATTFGAFVTTPISAERTGSECAGDTPVPCTMGAFIIPMLAFLDGKVTMDRHIDHFWPGYRFDEAMKHQGETASERRPPARPLNTIQ